MTQTFGKIFCRLTRHKLRFLVCVLFHLVEGGTQTQLFMIRKSYQQSNVLVAKNGSILLSTRNS